MSVALKLTLAEYDRMIERGAFERLNRRIELIRGELREMNPAGPIHDDIISFLDRWSMKNTSDDEVTIRAQCGLDLPELTSVLEPDIAWMRSNRYLARRPQPEDVLLVIEVADSSLDRDLDEKLQLYAAARIAEYWVVDVNDQSVHVFREPSGKTFRFAETIHLGQQVSPLAAPNAYLNINLLFDIRDGNS